MKRLSFILSVALLFNLDVTAQRSCGLWLNEVPLVADTVAGTIYATIDPGVNGTLKATLRWDNNLYNGIELNVEEPGRDIVIRIPAFCAVILDVFENNILQIDALVLTLVFTHAI